MRKTVVKKILSLRKDPKRLCALEERDLKAVHDLCVCVSISVCPSFSTLPALSCVLQGPCMTSTYPSTHVHRHEILLHKSSKDETPGVALVVGVHLPRLCYSRGCRWVKGEQREGWHFKRSLQQSRGEQCNLIFRPWKEVPWNCLGDWRIWRPPAVAGAQHHDAMLCVRWVCERKGERKWKCVTPPGCAPPSPPVTGTCSQPVWGLVLVTFCWPLVTAALPFGNKDKWVTSLLVASKTSTVPDSELRILLAFSYILRNLYQCPSWQEITCLRSTSSPFFLSVPQQGEQWG